MVDLALPGRFVGLFPLFDLRLVVEHVGRGNPSIAVALGLLGFPYMLMALMMSFLHDDASAAWPWAVMSPSFGWPARSACSVCFWLGRSRSARVLRPRAEFIRPNFFWLYVLVCFGVLDRRAVDHDRGDANPGTLLLADHNKDVLKWHAKRPRWGVAWRL